MPQLAGTTTITTTGPAQLLVDVPIGAQLIVPIDPPRAHGFASLTTTGTYAALAIVDTQREAGRLPVNATQVHQPAPYGCTPQTAVAARACTSPFDHSIVHTAPAPP